MSVIRKVKGKRYCIIHAGWLGGWVGDPWIWPAKYGGGSDYHENMNANIFEDYFESLCQHCQSEFGTSKVIFVMDNAKYHRREFQGKGNAGMKGDDSDGESDHRTLSTLKREQLIERLCSLNVERKTICGLTRAKLYKMAKRPEYKVPLATEVIAQRYGYHPRVASNTQIIQLNQLAKKNFPLITICRYGHRILWLPPYHPDINPIEEGWGVTKEHVGQVNDGSDFALVKNYIHDGFDKADDKWFDLVRRSEANELRYILKDRIRLNEPL